MADLFDAAPAPAGAGAVEVLEPGAALLRGFARDRRADLRAAIASIAEAAPFRHLETPGGRRMSVAMTNCGALGWISDRRGYRYVAEDPLTDAAWPAMPETFSQLAREAAAAAGFADFAPDCCLVNRYAPGAALSLHQDRDEADLMSPIVSVSLGLPATFLWGGRSRGDKVRRLPLASGDVAVWGGPARLVFHGVAKLAAGEGEGDPDGLGVRLNLTFRRTGSRADLKSSGSFGEGPV